MKKLGVIGGMGPEATAYFYEGVIAHTKANSDQEHLNMVILNQASMPDRTKAILTGDDAQLLATMKECATSLEYLGCENIAIPCNTSHYFYDQIQSFTKAHVIHMPRVAVAEARDVFDPDHTGIRVGILASEGTVKSGIYARECEAIGLEAVVPSADGQAAATSIIYDEVKAGKPVDMKKFNRVMREFYKADCSAVILACTEFSVLKRDHEVPDICLDAMDVLIRESIILSGAEYVA